MIAVMDRVEIVLLRELLEEVTQYLHGRGHIQIEDVPLAFEAAPGYLHRVHLNAEQKAELAELEDMERAIREVTPLMTARAAHEQYQRALKQASDLGRTEWPVRVRHIAQEIRGLTRQRVALQDNLEVLRNYERLLQSLEPLLGAREVHFGRDARAIVLKGDIPRAVERLTDRLNTSLGQNEYEFIQRRMGRGTLVGVIKYKDIHNDAVSRVLREQGIDPVDVPEKEAGSTTPRAILDRISRTIAKEEAELANVNAQIDKFSTEHCAELAAFSTLVSDRLREVRALGGFAQSNLLAVIHGWVPQDETAALKGDLEAKFPGKVELATLPADDVPHEQIPTLLKNPSWLRPFEVLLALYKPPTYGTIDPTMLVAITFVLFYGFILGDMGYGLCVMGFAYWLRKKWGHIDLVTRASTVGYCMGVSSIVFGFLYMEMFGDLLERVFHWHPIWLHRKREATELMTWAIAIGAIHVPLSLILGIREDFKHEHTSHALEKLALLIGLGGVAIAAFRNFDMAPFNTAPMFYLMIAMFIAFAGIMIKAAGKMAGILMLEIVSLVGNVLSYCRLMALGVAGVVIADLANLAGTSLNPLLGIPLALAIHLFALVLGMFSPTLHSLRLNYVESLPKFYSPYGKTFNPFRKEATW